MENRTLSIIIVGDRGGLNNLYNVWIIIKSAAKFLRKLIFPEEPPGGSRAEVRGREREGLEDIFVFFMIDTENDWKTLLELSWEYKEASRH